MLALRKALAALFLVFATVAFALTPGERVVLFSGIKPVWQANFLSPVLVASQTLPAGLTYTKSGSIPATLFDSTGKLTYQGNNLKTYSNTFTDASWTKGSTTISNANAVADPFGGTQASTITATGAYGYLQGLYSSTTGYNAISSIWVRLRSGNGAINLYNTNGTGAVAKTATSNWQQIYVSGTSGGVYTYLKMEIPNNGDVLDIYQGGISLVTYETTPRSVDQQITTSSIYLAPRLDTKPATTSPAGLLVEEQRVQIFSYSNAFTTLPWAKTGASTALTSAAITSPDGTSNGWKVQTGVATETFGIYQPFTYTAAAYTISIFAKAGSYNYICLDFNNAGTSGAVFDLSDGSIGYTDAGVTASVQTIGNGWYRLSATSTRAAASQFPEFYFSTSRTSNSKNFTGDGSQYFYAYGAQLELGSFPTSYIPNATASTVTRTADVVQFAGVPLAALQGAQVTTGAEVLPYAYSIGASRFVLSDLAVVNVPIFKAASNSTARIYKSGTIAEATIGGGGSWAGGLPLRIMSSWNASVGSIVANGGTVASGTPGLSSITNMYLGSDSSANFMNGWFRSLAFYSQRLPNPTLQQKSVVGAPW